MNNTLFIESNGFALDENEEKDMKMLSEYAQQGWVLEKLEFTGYRLKRDKPQQIMYNLALEKNPNEEYFRMFEEAEWKHVCSYNYFHFFKAPQGTTPIYTDQESVKEKYKIGKEKHFQFLKRIVTVVSLAILITIFAEIGWLPALIGNISLLVGVFSFIALPFALLPYVSYRKKYIQEVKNGTAF